MTYDKFLETHKKYFGFADFSITIVDKTDVESDCKAEIEVDQFENTLEITLYKGFLESEDKENILVHELIHGRLALFEERLNDRMKSLKYHEEEQMVNELTRGFMAFLQKKQGNNTHL